MLSLRLFRTICCAGLLLAGVFGLIQPAAQAQSTLEVTEEATAEATDLPTYQVQFLAQDETLNIYAGPGVQYPVVGRLGFIDEFQATGDEQVVGDRLWLPIQSPYDSSITGWIDRLYAVQQIDPVIFCADADMRALVDEVIAAADSRDGKLLAQTILPARGLYLGGLDWSQRVHLSETEVQNFFKDSTIRDWGTGMYDPTVITGSIHDLILPLIVSDMLPKTVTIACEDGQAGETGPNTVYLGTGLDALPFYSVMRPGGRGHELDWGAWALGIDDWAGTPVLAYLTHYFWTP